jgi:5-methylcytosine-specific restriction endonuclease McrA
MIELNPAVAVMDDEDLLASTHELARKSCGVEAELLHHIGEIDARGLYSQRAFPSMIVFCIKELRFSEGAAYNRILVARAARRLPAILEALGSRQVHLAGLRVLVPHLTEENHEAVLAEAAGKSKREIEELAARLAPKLPVPDVVRKLPERALLPLPEVSAPATVTRLPLSRRPVVAPLSAETFKIQFTGSRQVRDKLRQAQDLLRHRVPNGDLAVVFEKGLDALISNLLKERAAVGRKPRRGQAMAAVFSTSPDIPDPIKRAVWQRDGGQCAFISDDGRRCCETGGLEFDHIDGFAQTHMHDVDRIRLLCRAHNQHAADQLYGRVFMERGRESRKEAKAAPHAPEVTTRESPTRPGASCQQVLF